MRFLLVIIFIFFGVPTLFAHPLDVSNTTMTLNGKRVIGVTYVHPVELDRILIANGSVTPMDIGVDTYYMLTGVLVKYLSETLQVENKGTPCKIGEYTFQEEMMIDEIFSQGFPISYVFECDTIVEHPIITINFMIDVPLQTNRLFIYRVQSGKVERTDYRVLNARKNSHTLKVVSQSETLPDTDRDGVYDEDELIYRTDPNHPDTDRDGYGDGVEINKSWDPLSGELSPGQYAYEGDPLQAYSPEDQSVLGSSGVTLTENSGVWGSVMFEKVLRQIRLYIDRDGESRGIMILLFSVGLLGFFHALGPGHSKGILVSQILDEHMSYTKSILYCAIFTLVHLLDIIIVVVLSKFFFAYLDSSTYLSYISRMSAIIVIFVGTALLVLSIRKYIERKKEIKITTKSIEKKNYILMAIITGLTPCAFGWTIFLMLLALGKTYLAFPLLLALGAGIFLCLFLIASFTWYSKMKVYKLSPKISLLSPIISSLFILLIGGGLVAQNF